MTASVSVSALGTWSYNVGIAVYAYRATHSTNWVAAATVGRYVPALLLTWIGSRWIDRFPRRTVAVVADLVCAAAMVLITLVAVARGPLVLAIALAAVSSAAARVQSSAALSVAADIVVESQLVKSTVLMSTAEAVATAVGPALASAVLTVYSPAVLFAANAVTFLGSAALLRGVDAARVRRPTTAPAGGSHEVAYKAAIRATWPLLASRATAAFVYGFDIVALAVIATRQLKQGTNGYGLMLAASGLGGLVVALLLRRSSGGRAGLVSTLGMALYALPLVVFAAHPNLGANLTTQLVRGIGAVMVISTVTGALQRAVPSSVSGRIFGLAHTLVLAGTCVGALAVLLALRTVGFTTTLVLAAFVPFAAQLVLGPAFRRFDRHGVTTLAALDPRVDMLRRLDLFRDASRATLYDVADHAVEEHVNGVIVREGDVADALFVLVSGSVEVTKQADVGQVTLRRMAAPSYFGEIGLIHGVPRTATVSALDACTVWRIPAEVFLAAARKAGISGALADTVRLRVEDAGP
jgi:Cyclic nucleotide-binding domain/Major Facilitator Superfamily